MKKNSLVSLAAGVGLTALVAQSCSSNAACADAGSCAPAGGAGGDLSAAGRGGNSTGAAQLPEAGQGGASGNDGAAGTVASSAGSSGAGGSDSTPEISLNLNKVVRVVPGGTASIAGVLTRNGFSGPVEITLEGLPAGVDTTAITLTSTRTDIDLPLTARDTAAIGGPFQVKVHATGTATQADFSVSLYVTGLPGEPDTTFGEDQTGRVSQVIVGLTQDSPRRIAVDSKSRIVVAGNGNDSIGGELELGWLARFDAAGALDLGFGSGGKALLSGAAHNSVSALTLFEDAPIVAGSVCCDGSAPFLRKFTESGVVDPVYGFGKDVPLGYFEASEILTWRSSTLVLFGALAPPIEVAMDGLRDPAFAPSSVTTAADVAQNGFIYASPRSDTSLNAVRMTPTGAIDPKFGVMMLYPPSGTDEPRVVSVVNAQDSSVLLLAQSHIAGGDYLQNEIDLIHLTALGDQDPMFGNHGTVVVSSAGLAFQAFLQVDGSIIVLYADRVASGPTTASSVARFSSAGVLDSSFGTGGIIHLSEIIPGFMPDVMAYDAPGNRLVVGGTKPEVGGGVLLLRYWL